MLKYVTAILFSCLIGAFIVNCDKNQKDPAAKTNVDLTQMSGTMVYAEVYRIMTDPEKYLGDTIKASGVYQAYCSEEDTTECDRFIVIADAGGCCPSGLEIIRNHTCKSDYPENGTTIETSGEFKSYENSDETYYYLAVDDIKVLKKKN